MESQTFFSPIGPATLKKIKDCQNVFLEGRPKYFRAK